MTTIIYERAPRIVENYVGGRMVPGRTVYDYKVIIDGEWRATFTTNATWHRAGFSMSDRTGKSFSYDIRHMGAWDRGITKSDFDACVQKVLPQIATVAEVERHITMEAAWADNRKFDEDRANYKARIRREMLSEALTQYVDNARAAEEDQSVDEYAKVRAAEAMLQQMKG